MNPLTNVKNITKLNEIELSKGTTDKKSWHDIYKGSAWIFIGGLAYGLTEGDVLAVFSQYGEIVNINLVRDKKTGKTKGFCFLCYANQKSTILAVDNFNGIKLLNRTIRVDHVANYKPPKDNEFDDDITKQLKSEGCAPQPIKQETSPVHVASSSKKKKSKKEKKKRKKDKKKAEDKTLLKESKIKKEKHDPGYDKYELPQISARQSNKSTIRSSDGESSTSGESSDDSATKDETRAKKKSYGEKVDKPHNKSRENASTYHKDHGDKYSSGQKRNLKDSESDSDDSYVKQKKRKVSHSGVEKRNSSDVCYSKHVSKHKSESSSPNDDERNVQKASRYEQHNTSHSSSFKNSYISENGRKETTRQQRRSSSSEDIDESKAHFNKSGERDFSKQSRSETSRCDEYDRRDVRNNHYKSDLSYNGDRCNVRDRDDSRNTDFRSDRRHNDPVDHRSNAGKSSGRDLDEQTHSRRYSDSKDRKRHDYKKNAENSNRDSFKYSRSTRNISSEREERYSSKYRDQDDNRKDWYDRRKR